MRTFKVENDVDGFTVMVEFPPSPFGKGNWIIRQDLVNIVNKLPNHINKTDLCMLLGVDQFDIDIKTN